MRKVKTKWIIPLSSQAKIFVKEGQVVTIGKVIATEPEYNWQVVNMSGKLGKNSETVLAEINKVYLGKKTREGDLLYSYPGWFGLKVLSPATGVIIKTDELQNIYFQVGSEDRRSLISPVPAKVVEVNSERVVLEFRADEYSGKCVVEGKAWADNGLEYARKIGDINYGDESKIMIVDNLLSAMIAKSEVMGAVGMVVLNQPNTQGDGSQLSKLPVLLLNPEETDALLAAVKTSHRAMINTLEGRLLIVEKNEKN